MKPTQKREEKDDAQNAKPRVASKVLTDLVVENLKSAEVSTCTGANLNSSKSDDVSGFEDWAWNDDDCLIPTSAPPDSLKIKDYAQNHQQSNGSCFVAETSQIEANSAALAVVPVASCTSSFLFVVLLASLACSLVSCLSAMGAGRLLWLQQGEAAILHQVDLKQQESARYTQDFVQASNVVPFESVSTVENEDTVELRSCSCSPDEGKSVPGTMEWMKTTPHKHDLALEAIITENYKGGFIVGWDNGRKQGYDEALSDIIDHEKRSCSNDRHHLMWNKVYMRGFHAARTCHDWGEYHEKTVHVDWLNKNKKHTRPMGIYESCIKLYEQNQPTGEGKAADGNPDLECADEHHTAFIARRWRLGEARGTASRS